MKLELRDVTAGYGDSTVLRNVNVAVSTGRVVALLGPNGAGKSTLLRVATGLVGHRSGAVELDGESLKTLAPHDVASKGVCHITEGRAIFGALSVRENLRLFSVPGEESTAVDKAVTLFPILGERINQVAGTMSGGEQQMLALSRAWTSGCKILLVDELSLGLAPIIVGRLFEALQQIVELGLGLLIVEQYVNKALEMAEQVFILNRGSVVFSGRSDEVDREQAFAQYMGA